MNTIHCQHCGKEFSTRRSDAKFCSNACRQQGYLGRIADYNNRVYEQQFQADQEKQGQSDTYNAELQSLQQERQALNESRARKEIEDMCKSIDSRLKRWDMELQEAAIVKTNELLKGWISKLLEFDRQSETSLDKAKWLYYEITRFNEHDKAKLPADYQHLGFIVNILVPKITAWNDQAKNIRDRYINFQLAGNLKKQLADLLEKL